MKLENKDQFLKKSQEILDELFDQMNQLPSLDIDQLDRQHTALMIVDMVNGFAREGALKSPRIEDLILDIANLSAKCDLIGIEKVAFADCHPKESPEFAAYPKHCLAKTSEAEVVAEIKEAGGYELILKNSTNGFLEKSFQKWLKNHSHMNTFIIAGDCTDICIQQLAVTLKTWFNMNNLNSRIIVPMNLVDTYDLDIHNGDLMNVMAVYNMMCNGVEVIKTLQF